MKEEVFEFLDGEIIELMKLFFFKFEYYILIVILFDVFNNEILFKI